MHHIFLSAKIRDLNLTAVKPNYEGSISLDEEYLERAGIHPYEEVHVLNLSTGNRLVTYAIKGKRGSGCVQLNGPAARSGMVGDEIMVLAYVLLEPSEMKGHAPRIISIKPKP